MSDRNDRIHGARLSLEKAVNHLDEVRSELSKALTESSYPRDVLLQAFRQDIVVTFEYRNPSAVFNAEVTTRTVSPFELSEDSVLGFDHDRDAIRRFRLDRIVGDVELSRDVEYVRPS